jgi:phytoene synthase
MSTRPEMRAFIKVVKKFNLRREYLESFIDSMRMDLEKKEHMDMPELQQYMYGSATVVGLLMMQIVGDFKDEAIPYAKSLAEAMQLTNFLRDIKDDWYKRGRVYIPQDELIAYNLNIDDIKRCQLSEPFIKFKIEQALALFSNGENGIHLLPPKAQFPILLSSKLYIAILNEIKKQNYNVFKKRVRVNIWQKIIITFKTYIWYRRNM